MNAKDALAPALDSTPVVIHRQDYQPPDYRIDQVQLDFTLDLTATRVINEFDFERTAASANAALTLHGDELNFERVSLDGVELSADQFSVSPQHLTIHSPPAKGRLRVETRLDPTANTALMGLYASRGGLFTQCESEGFRRITYFLDRPDVMATYTVVMRGLKSEFPVMLSNGNLLAQRDLGQGWHEAHWHDPFPKPSYLFALVAADLDHIEETITTRSGKKALLQVYTRKDDLSQAGFALASLKRAIFWDETRFGLELDLERFMIVAVPDFNSGAMENKGLNLFNTKFVLADPQTATDVDFDGIESVVAHEYFHNWTGNRITCRDWFQLTLKEGLTVFRDAEFSADMAAQDLTEDQAQSARAVRRIDSVRVLRAAQFPEDAGPMAHPIRPDHYQEIRNFYTATVYEKGAEVIRMLQTMLGVDGFRKGMDLYFARHDGQAVTCDEFVHAIFDANGQSGADLFMRWYDTSGTPHVLVTDHVDRGSNTYTLEFKQQIADHSPSRAPLMMPIRLGLIDGQGKSIDLSSAVLHGDAVFLGDTLIMKDWQAKLSIQLAQEVSAAPVPAAALPSAPVPSLLRDFSAPVFLDYDYSDDQLLHLLAHDTDPFNRWEAGQRLMLGLMLRKGDASAPSGKNLPLGDQHIVEAFRRIAADPGLDNAYKAAVLTLPAEAYVAERVLEIDPAAIRLARNRLRIMLATALKAELHAIDQALAPVAGAPYSPDPLSTGRRSLANLAQHWLGLIGEISPPELLARFERAGNMTDRLCALQVLVELDGKESRTALKHYLEEFSHHALALDKWFTVQATLLEDQCLDRVRSLLAHPDFDATNPNRLRSLLGAFFHQNLPGFHRADGAGYALWAEQVIEIDQRNSQLASRMARALDRWARFEPVRRAAMKKALERVAAEAKLSPDVREVISKALG